MGALVLLVGNVLMINLSHKAKASIHWDGGFIVLKLSFMPYLERQVKGQIGILAEDQGYIFGKVTVAISGVELGEDEVTVKTYSENLSWVPQLLKSGLFTDTGKRVTIGYAQAEIWKVNTEKWSA